MKTEALLVNPTFKIPLWFLILNNIIPILGLLFWNWRILDVVLVMALEVVVFSLISVIKIIFIRNSIINSYTKITTVSRSSYSIFRSKKREKRKIEKEITNPIHIKINAISFIFILVFMGVFLLAIALIDKLNVNFDYNLLYWGLIPLISHTISFIKNYILGKEYLKKQPMDIVNKVGHRIATIMIVLWVGVAFGSEILLVWLLWFRTFIDYNLHIKEHKTVYLSK